MTAETLALLKALPQDATTMRIFTNSLTLVEFDPTLAKAFTYAVHENSVGLTIHYTPVINDDAAEEMIGLRLVLDAMEVVRILSILLSKPEVEIRQFTVFEYEYIPPVEA